MGFVRRASLVLGLTLIIAIAVGFVARRSDLAGHRDRSLTAAAELGASRLTSAVQSVELAARSGIDPAATAEAIAALDSRLGVCVITTSRNTCAGDGPRPSARLLQDHQNRRLNGVDIGDGRAVVTVVGPLVTIDAVGENLTVITQTPIEVLGNVGGGTDDVNTWVTSMLPADLAAGGFGVEDESRRTAARVDAQTDLFVIAATHNSISFSNTERQAGLIIFAHAVALLFLAVYTLANERRRLVERATIDPLTRLPNRSEFEQRSEHALADASRSGRAACLLLFDLDGFKNVNDSYGHQVGDELLTIVGSRLRGAVRRHDVVARWGGDEFVVLMPGISNVELGERRARELAECVGGPTRLDGFELPLTVTVSVGAAMYPYHAPDLSALIEAADAAMYQAKKHGAVVSSAPLAGAATLSPIRL